MTAQKKGAASGNRVAVIAAYRSPFVKSFGVFEKETPLSLSVNVATETIARSGVEARDIEECLWGAVVPLTKNANLARDIVLFAGLPKSISGVTLNKACTSSLEAAQVAADAITLGRNKLVLVGGVECLSDVPITYSDEAKRFFTKLSKSRSLKEKLGLLSSLNPKWFLPKPPALAEPYTGLTMGEHSEIMCVKNNISRARQDELAYMSHQKAFRAEEKGFLKEQIIPVWSGVDKSIFVEKDNLIRHDTTLETLSKLRPAFDKANGTITAGNASPLTDGASAMLLASESYAQEKNHPILGYIVDSISFAVDPNDQLLIAPAYVIPWLLAKQGLKLEDVGVFELHEAFAGQLLSCLDAMNDEKFCKEKLNLPVFGRIPDEKINIDGGAIAIGHPFGATGVRMIGNALRIAQRTNSEFAVVAICAAGGMGMAMLLQTK